MYHDFEKELRFVKCCICRFFFLGLEGDGGMVQISPLMMKIGNGLLEFGDLEEMEKEILLVFVGSCCFIWSCINRKIFV